MATKFVKGISDRGKRIAAQLDQLKSQNAAAAEEQQRRSSKMAELQAELEVEQGLAGDVEKYAQTSGKPVDVARAEIIEQRRAAAEQARDPNDVAKMSPAEFRGYAATKHNISGI